MTATGARVAFLACGALAPETAEIVRRRGWNADVHGVSAFHHLMPPRIVEDVDRKLAELAPRYEVVIVVYGDCGTGGRLDAVLRRYPAVRPAGVHCYEWFSAERFEELSADVGVYFLTDWLVRSWETAVIRGLGLDRFPWLKDTYFGSLTHVVYLRQDPDPDGELDRRAGEIAAFLGRPLEVVASGLEPLEERLARVMEETDVRT